MPVLPWQEWGEAAFARAAAEDKPILLALTAPWSTICQTMDRDSWSDAEVVQLASGHYVPIRGLVDLRPDILDRYTAGMVPSTVFLTPQGQLMWGGTYMPPHDLKMALARLYVGYAANKDRLAEAIRERDARIDQVREGQYEGRVTLSDDILAKTIDGIIATYDVHNGGFGAAPKSPLPSSLEVLRVAAERSLHPKAKEVLARTLDAILKGLWDPIDGGFFTFARTEQWTQPETEKLLIDQVALIRVYAEAGDLFSEPRYRDISAKTADYVQRVLRDPGSGSLRAGQVADPGYYGLDAAGRKGRPAPEVPPLVRGNPNLLRDAVEVSGSAALDGLLKTFSEGGEAGLLDRRPGWEELGELSFRRRPLNENARVARSLARLGRKEEARRILGSFPDFGIDYGHLTAEYAMAVDATLHE